MKIRVLLVDDTPAVREELRALLEGDPGIELVGEAEEGRRAMEMIAGLSVDVVVLDIDMPLLCGTATIGSLLGEMPDARIVQICTQADPRYARESLRAGVSGYVLKDCAYEELLEAVYTVATGERYVSPEIEIGIP